MNLVKVIGLGALGALALGLGSWKIFGNKADKSKKPTRQQTLQILQTIRQEFYPILLKIADIVSKQLAPKGLTPEQNEKIIMMDPSIKMEIEKINEKVYSNFSQEQIREATEKIYKDDGDIMKQKKQFTEQFKKSLLGVKPDPNIIISRKLHKNKVLQAISEILQDKIARCQTQNVEQTSQKEILAFLQKDVEEDERVTKQKIKQKLGLCAKDAIKIFHFVVLEYKKTDESFRDKYLQLVDRYNTKIKQVMKK